MNPIFEPHTHIMRAAMFGGGRAPAQVADSALFALREDGWRFVSVPALTVIDEGVHGVWSPTTGYKHLQITGAFEGQRLKLGMRLYPYMNNRAMAYAERDAADKYANELGRNLGLPL